MILAQEVTNAGTEEELVNILKGLQYIRIPSHPDEMTSNELLRDKG